MKKNFNTTLEKIKEHGYWTVRFLPTKLEKQKIGSHLELKEILRNNSLELRGWDYPHFPTEENDHQNIYRITDHIEAWIDWDRHKEVLRLYDNKQYIHLFSLREDWSNEDVFSPRDDPYKQWPSDKYLEIISTIYSITEIFAFLRNLCENNFYTNDVNVEISLRNIKDRKLIVWDPRRAPLFNDYKCFASQYIFSSRLVTREEILTNFQDIALSYAIELFVQFQWENPPIEVFKQDQKNLFEKKL